MYKFINDKLIDINIACTYIFPFGEFFIVRRYHYLSLYNSSLNKIRDLAEVSSHAPVSSETGLLVI